MGIKRHKPEEIVTKLQQVEVLCGSPQQTGCARHHRTHCIVQCLGRVCMFAPRQAKLEMGVRGGFGEM